MGKFAITRGCLVFYFFLLLATIEAQNDNFNSPNDRFCVTPRGESGECVSIRQCRILFNLMMTRPLLPSTILFLRSAMCGINVNPNDANVCCPVVASIQNTMVPKNPNLPSKCGSDLSLKIVGARKCELSEFPWMALLEYTTSNGIATDCGGALISDRYVLTVAHCLSERYIPSGWSLSSVRLGEYDTTMPFDCLPDMVGGQICAENPLSVPIEERIIHESYQSTLRNSQNDIALLRLSRPVRFTGYIKPICLPTLAEVPANMWVAGWGQTENGTASDVKRKLNVPRVDPLICLPQYRTANIVLGSTQICAGGVLDQDTCSGDSGSPLMGTEQGSDLQQKWTVVGLVSFGTLSCGTEHWPGVYTKVIDFVPWILRKLRP